MSQQRFLTVTESGPTSFGAFAPDIQGCIAFTTSRRELMPLFTLAAESHMRELVDAGEPLPIPETTGFPPLEVGVQSGTITLEWATIDMPIAA